MKGFCRRWACRRHYLQFVSEGLAVVDGLAGAGVEHVHNPLVRLVSGERIKVLNIALLLRLFNVQYFIREAAKKSSFLCGFSK